MIKVRPLAARVIVRREEAEEVSKGGIIIVEEAKEKPARGVVTAIGEGYRSENGTITPLDIEVGDVVLFGKYAGSEINLEDEHDYLLLTEMDIQAVIEE
jgi:chaperonin GroES